MEARFPSRTFEYQIVTPEGHVEEAHGYDDRDIFDMNCSAVLDALYALEKLVIFEYGKAVLVWEFNRVEGVHECKDVETMHFTNEQMQLLRSLRHALIEIRTQRDVAADEAEVEALNETELVFAEQLVDLIVNVEVK